MIVLTTDRLILREFELKDAKAMYELNSDEEVMKYTGDIRFESLEHSKKMIENYSDYERNGFGRWAAITREGKEFIGWCGLKKIEDGTVDVGYRFFKKYWNNGFATESAKACLDYGFGVLELKEIVAQAAKENVGSIKVMEKIGMKFDKETICNGIPNAVRYKLETPYK